VDSALDPAPVSMIETVVEYAPEWSVGADGEPVRNWRDEIHSVDDLWAEIVRVAQIPGLTSAPKLQPIAARIVMLQSGMRAPMGLKVRAPDLDTLDRVALRLEQALRGAPGVAPDTVFADRVVGKPYLEIEVDRAEAARYALSITELHDVIETALGGKVVTWTVEERERYAVRVRYPRELRDEPADLDRIRVPTPDGGHVPLGQVAKVAYRAGPMMIRTEDTQLVAYVIFDKLPNLAEVGVVEDAGRWLDHLVATGELEVPAGVSWAFAGSYENQVRAAATLRVVLPLALAVIFLILYFHFRSTVVALMIFSGVIVSWAGGFLLLWLYGREGFLDFELFGANFRELFQVREYNLSVAVWVGFLALFGIATDDGVVMGTYLQQSFAERTPGASDEVRAAVLAAGKRRVRACLMTTSTTLLALLPVLTSTGRGSDVMVPMAIPSFGGMILELTAMFIVPTLYCLREERRLRRQTREPGSA
jgi:Cu(I)/Ag(I) efflux system membrane protein CusA/SilA